MKSVRMEEITAAWVVEHLPAVAEAIAANAAAVERAAAAGALDAAVCTARLEAATAERERILAIEALPFQAHELRERFVRDPEMTSAQAALEILRADRGGRRARLQALVDDEHDLVPPSPGPSTETNPTRAAKDAVALAVKHGVIA